ncbi:MAG: Ig-like domain-containing domain, partial [Bacteroidota bacterium]|nr:Ig-like domain-containing domain [Bacteroidota bacterium]
MRIRKIAFSIIYLIIVSCAVQVAPKGGPKDINPPEVLTESPKNESINFNAKEIVIKFNEFIQLNDIHNKMIISPPIEPFPEISINKKSIVIKIEEKLEDNTTYKFQFGESVVDITERNPLKDFNYVISTGNKIDSLRIRGKIKGVYRDENEKKIKVLLYIAGNDSSIYNEKPKYFSKTTEDGSFEITNIKEGRYNIFALQDKNENYKYDFGEKVGFTNKSIELVKDTNIGEIKIFAEQVSYSNVISVEL